MSQNINSPKNETDRILGINRNIFLIIVILLCVLSLCVGIYAQFFYKYSESDPLMFGLVTVEKKEEENIVLRSNFDNIFTNEFIKNEDRSVTKIDENQDIIYNTQTTEEVEEKYNINANIPTININSDAAKQMNDDIAKNFTDEITRIKSQNDVYKVYTVTYISYLNGDLLSLAVKSIYYEQEGMQTTNIKTYNYNLNQNASICLEKIMEAKGLKPDNVQKDIINELKKLNENESEIEYSKTVRNLDDDMYKIANTNTFLVSNEGVIYLIYNYGTKKDVLVY